jgi:hypothetical protein
MLRTRRASMRITAVRRSPWGGVWIVKKKRKKKELVLA